MIICGSLSSKSGASYLVVVGGVESGGAIGMEGVGTGDFAEGIG